MALPIFLRPLLLIKYYWQTLVYTLNRWLQRSNEELFGPLEQIIVAVVITGIAMNPSVLYNLGGPAPGVPMPYPMTYLPPNAYPPINPAPPAPPVPPQGPPTVNGSHDTAPTLPNTSNGTAPAVEPANTGYAWLDLVLDLLPAAWRPNPITIALGIMLINLLWHIVPRDLLHRLTESWRVFWPPWQDRSAAPSSSVAGSGRSRATNATDPPRDPEDSTKDDVKANDVARDRSKAEAEVKVPNQDKDKDRERAKRKAMAEYQARKEAEMASKPPGDSGAKARSVSPSTSKNKDGDKTETSKATSRSETAQSTKSPPEESMSTDATIGDADTTATEQSGHEDDPLMAGDYRPLRSILKKSKKKPRQSKNVHHNYFMGMRGHQAHLIPFPHGLHPPPHEPRHTMWWRNIPKDATHLMAPPPPPKEVKDDGREEDNKGGDKDKDKGKGDEEDKTKTKDKEKEKDNEKEKKKSKPTESEATAKLKERAAKEDESKATAVAKIERPSDPDVPVDPQVQKATWASQAMLCLLLFSIQQQLGLILLAIFVWSQLNSHATAQERREQNQPFAVATAEAEAPPPRPVKKEEAMPPEMRAKLDRAKPEDESGNRDSSNDVKAEKSEGKPSTDETPTERMKRKLAAMSPDERKKYERYMEQKEKKSSGEGTTLARGSPKEKKEEGKQKETTPQERMKRKLAAMSSQERDKYERYMKQKAAKAAEGKGAEEGAVLDKGKSKAMKDTKETPEERTERKMKGMSPEERRKYEINMQQKQSEGDRAQAEERDTAGRDKGKQRALEPAADETAEERMKRKLKAMSPDQQAECKRYMRQKSDRAKQDARQASPREKPRALTREEKEAYYRAREERLRAANQTFRGKKVTIEDVPDEQAGGSGLSAEEKATL